MRSRHRRGLVGIGPVQDDGELVAAQACHQVVATDDLPDARSDLAEQRVPGLVPEGVVDLLEVIEVDQQEGQAAACVAALGQRGQGPVELVEQATTVAEPGELVGHRLLLLRLIEAPLLAQCQTPSDHARHERSGREAEGDRTQVLHIPTITIKRHAAAIGIKMSTRGARALSGDRTKPRDRSHTETDIASMAAGHIRSRTVPTRYEPEKD